MTVTILRTLEEDSMLYDLTGVTKRYTQGRKTVDALAGIDLQIAEGEFLVIQGSTGSGKTTLLQMLGALDRPSSGSLVYEGRDVAKLGEGDLTELRSHSYGFSSSRSTSSPR